jgi:hypothetical protein
MEVDYLSLEMDSQEITGVRESLERIATEAREDRQEINKSFSMKFDKRCEPVHTK